jgi:hypothetical protein
VSIWFWYSNRKIRNLWPLNSQNCSYLTIERFSYVGLVRWMLCGDGPPISVSPLSISLLSSPPSLSSLHPYQPPCSSPPQAVHLSASPTQASTYAHLPCVGLGKHPVAYRLISVSCTHCGRRLSGPPAVAARCEEAAGGEVRRQGGEWVWHTHEDLSDPSLDAPRCAAPSDSSPTSFATSAGSRWWGRECGLEKGCDDHGSVGGVDCGAEAVVSNRGVREGGSRCRGGVEVAAAGV